MTTQVLAVPSWLIFLRGAQIFFSLFVLGVAAYGVYGVAFSGLAFAIFTSLITLIVVIYGITTSKISKWAVAYNYWAILAFDIWGVIFWLSTMGALAALRSIFVIPTTVNGCGHTGDIGGGYCWKRDLSKRNYVAANTYLSVLSCAAAFSAINFVLFIVTLVFTGIALHRARKDGTTTAATDDSKLESHGMEAVSQPPPPASYGQPTQVQYQQPPPPANY